MAELDRMAMGGEKPLPAPLVEGDKPPIEDNQADDQEENEDSCESVSGPANPGLPTFVLPGSPGRQD